MVAAVALGVAVTAAVELEAAQEAVATEVRTAGWAEARGVAARILQVAQEVEAAEAAEAAVCKRGESAGHLRQPMHLPRA